MAESFFGSLKTEQVFFSNYITRDGAKKDVVDYIEMFFLTRYYTDDWGAYERHLDASKHEVGKRNTQKIKHKNLNFRR